MKNTDTHKLRILCINRWVGYNEGGGETYIKDLMSQFCTHHHTVTIMTTKGPALDQLPPQIQKVWIDAPRGYYTYSFLGPLNAALFIAKCFLAFLKLYVIDRRRFDIISVHFSLEAYLARFIKLFFGIPYILVLAGDTSLELIEGKRADGVTHLSHFMNQQSKKYGYSAKVIPKGFDLTHFKPNLHSTSLRQHLKLENKKIILTVCRLDPRKNIETLIRAMNILIHKFTAKNTVLLIIGDGIEKNHIEFLIQRLRLQKYIRLLGSLPNMGKDLPLYYAMSDLFVLPTLYEGFGIVFIEAMACGLPVLTTNRGSNPEIVGSDGILIEAKNPHLLATTIDATLNNKNVLKVLQTKGLRKARSFSWTNIWPQYEKYYLQTSNIKCNSLNCKLKTLYYLFHDTVLHLWNLQKSMTLINKLLYKEN